MNDKYLNQFEMDLLHEVIDGFIAEKTSVALSKLLSEPTDHNIKVTYKQASEFEKASNLVEELCLCSIFLKGEGDVRLGILYTVNENDAKTIAGQLLGSKLDSLDTLGISALSEVGNIMSGSFFNALSDNTGLRVDLSTPGFATTTLKTLLHPHAEEFVSLPADIITEVELQGANSGIKIHMLIIQDHDNARKLLKAKKG